MIRRQLLLAFAFECFVLGQCGIAEEPKPASSSISPFKRKLPTVAARPTSIAVIPMPGGRKAVNIHYRWPLHEKARIEVRLVPAAEQTGKEAVEQQIIPIYFHEQFKPDIQQRLFNMLDQTDKGTRQTYSFTKEKIVYKMIGERNSLGHQAVHVQVHHEDTKMVDRPAAVFLQLDAWAVNPQILSIDLLSDEFPKPGKLAVWFFRGDQVVWEEEVDWPGYGVAK